MRQLILLLFIMGLGSCGNQKTSFIEENSVGQVDASEVDTWFSEFLDRMQSHKTPIRLSCGLPDYVRTSEFGKYKKFLPTNYDALYGLVGQTEKFKCIMFGQVGDDIYPTLFTFDNKGKRIDSLSLILNPCGAADGEQIPNSFALIKEDLTIELTDTTRLIHFPENWESVDDYIVDSMRISKMTFKIDKQGRFVQQ